MAEASTFFKTEIKDGYLHELQTGGSLLLGTARRGDVQAKKVEFPIIKKGGDVVKLTGSLSEVKRVSGGFDKVSVDIDDYETDPLWVHTPDIEKIGVNIKQGLTEALANSVGRYRDKIQWDAMALYTSDAATDHGGAGVVPNPATTSEAKAAIMATGGMKPGTVYCPLKALWMEQFMVHEWFAKADWVGGDLPLTKLSSEKRSWNGVNYFVVPDDYFATPDAGTSAYTYLWQMDCIGVENNWGDITTMEQDKFTVGNPWMVKIGFGAAAVGILRPGVRRIRFANITSIDTTP